MIHVTDGGSMIGPRWRNGAGIAATLAYVAVAAYLSAHHEIWRDEARAMNIAAGSTPTNLIANLHNEGHPVVWYLLLWLAYLPTHSLLVLKPVSVLVGAAGVYIFMCAAPFALWQRALFSFGLFPLYENAVMARNYGISMLLIFVACVLYPRRWEKPLALAFTLALLANTNAHSLILVAALLLALGAELVLARRWSGLGWPQWGRLFAGLCLVLVASGFSVWLIHPDETTIVSGVADRSWAQVETAIVDFWSDPLRVCPELAGTVSQDTRDPPPALAPALRHLLTLAFWMFALELALRRSPLVLAWVAGALGFFLLDRLGYGLSTRHHGVFFVFLMAILWMTSDDGQKRVWRGLNAHRQSLLSIALILQLLLCEQVAAYDLAERMTAAPLLGAYIRAHPELANAVLVSEPDHLVEPLPYYGLRRIYLPREQRFFSTRVHFDTSNQRELSLDELNAAAKMISRVYKTRVLVLLGSLLRLDKPRTQRYGYGKVFRTSPEAIAHFRAHCTQLASFRGTAGDENYDLFELHM